MFDEDNEVADEAASTESVEAVEPEQEATVEATETVEAAESVESDETAADALEEAPEVFDWNGELDALKEASWFNGLEDAVRETALRGMTTKYRNLERGYTKAFQETALQRRSLEEREKEIRETELRVQRWLHGDVDPMAEKQKELELINTKHAAALDALRKEHEQAILKQQTSHTTKLDELIAARESAEELARNFEQVEAQREQAALDAEVDNFENWIQNEAPHVYENQEALYALCVQVASGIDKEAALRMVLGGYPAPEPAEPPPAEPEKVPEAVEMMNMGASPAANTTEQVDLSFDERMDILRRQYMAEAAQRNG